MGLQLDLKTNSRKLKTGRIRIEHLIERINDDDAIDMQRKNSLKDKSISGEF